MVKGSGLRLWARGAEDLKKFPTFALERPRHFFEFFETFLHSSDWNHLLYYIQALDIYHIALEHVCVVANDCDELMFFLNRLVTSFPLDVTNQLAFNHQAAWLTPIMPVGIPSPSGTSLTHSLISVQSPIRYQRRRLRNFACESRRTTTTNSWASPSAGSTEKEWMWMQTIATKWWFSFTRMLTLCDQSTHV